MRENAEIDLVDVEVGSAERRLERVPVVEPLELRAGRRAAFGDLHGAAPVQDWRAVTLRRLPHKLKCRRPCYYARRRRAAASAAVSEAPRRQHATRPRARADRDHAPP